MNIDHELLKENLRNKGIKICQLAKATQAISPSYMSAVVNGWQQIGPIVAEKLRFGLRQLGICEAEIEVIFQCPKK